MPVPVDPVAEAVAYVTARALTPDVAGALGLGVTHNARDVGAGFYPRAALTIPYFDAAGQFTGFGRVRYFDPPETGGITKKSLRYQQPKGTAPGLYLPRLPGVDWLAIQTDPAYALVITEGEVKSASVMWNTGAPCLGLGGVFMWADHKQPLAELQAFAWARRRVYIVFDSDIDTKVGVQLAEARLAEWLLRQGAVVHTARLPPAPDGGKLGADDFIALHGAQAFTEALAQTRSMSDMDLRVLELNRSIAWLEEEEKVIEIDTGTLFRKDSLATGSRYSTVKIPVQSGRGVKLASVAQAWLTHPMARRYVNTLFRPGAAPVVTDGGQTYINSWREQPCEPGDVALYLELTRWLFSETLGDNWEWPLKLLAYKVQHPLRKIPLAVMLIGEQGSGKSLWTDLTKAAFGAYGSTKAGKDLNQDWNGFLEKALFAVIDDVSARQMRAHIETLRVWISNPRITRIEKFLKNREIDNYALVFFTSNYRDAGAFAHDDRRFLVVGAPKRQRDTDYYAPLFHWLHNGRAGANIYHYLLNYDLQGWTPPVKAPDTAEKKMAYEESLSPFERLARDMQTCNEHIIEQWLRAAEFWALSVLTASGNQDAPRASEVLAALPAFPIRPWYTADELCNIFPHLLRGLDNSTRYYSTAALPGRVSVALRNHGIAFLRNTDDDDGFLWRGRRQQFLIVAPSAGYPKQMGQDEFDQAMVGFPRFKPAVSR